MGSEFIVERYAHCSRRIDRDAPRRRQVRRDRHRQCCFSDLVERVVEKNSSFSPFPLLHAQAKIRLRESIVVIERAGSIIQGISTRAVGEIGTEEACNSIAQRMLILSGY